MINVLSNSQFIPDLAKNLLHCRDDSRDELRPSYLPAPGTGAGPWQSAPALLPPGLGSADRGQAEGGAVLTAAELGLLVAATVWDAKLVHGAVHNILRLEGVSVRAVACVRLAA